MLYYTIPHAGDGAWAAGAARRAFECPAPPHRQASSGPEGLCHRNKDIYIYIHTYIYIYIFICIYIYICTCEYVYIYIYIYVFVYVHICMYIDIHNMYIYIYIYNQNIANKVLCSTNETTEGLSKQMFTTLSPPTTLTTPVL